MASILNATTSSGLVTSADNSGSLQLATNNGTTALTIDTSQNVGIGTASPQAVLNISSASQEQLRLSRLTAGSSGYLTFYANNSSATQVQYAGILGDVVSSTAGSHGGALLFYTTGSATSAERMRIDSSGNLLVGLTANSYNSKLTVQSDASAVTPFSINDTSTGSTSRFIATWYRGGSSVGNISITNTTTAYNTSSDYRLKENIAPMTGALAKVALLKPVTYKWKVDGSDGEGFIAHELQAVVPDAVTGEKDAVDADGNPIYQGIDTSFLVATLTAAIQEQQAQIEELKAEVQALKGTL